MSTNEVKSDDTPGYNDTVKAASLEKIQLTESKFFVKPEFFTLEGERELFRGEEVVSFSFLGEEKSAAAEIEYFASANLGGEEVFSAKCRYLIIFTFDCRVCEGDALTLIHRVGRFTAYPYFRQHVAQLNWEAGTDMPILPILKQTHQFKSKN